ncbi:MAG: glycosyltransferase family 2 protein [Actinobacteria bacterium]|nr:glycosyltransferase family 2 protein [Actinomycetota bacterium]
MTDPPASSPAAAEPAPLWAAVVVNFNAGPRLVRCVRSVLADTSAGEPEVIVVDNASVDGSVASLRSEVPEVLVLEPGANLGYARGANLGIAATRAEVVAVLNPDVEIDPGTGAAMLDRFDADERLGAAGPHIRDEHGATYPSARVNPSVLDAVGHAVLGPFAPENRFTRRYRQLDADPGRARDADWVSGAAIWLRRRALDTVGGWDEGFFLFMEDVDLCSRLRGAGFRVAYEPRAGVVHVEGVSRSAHPYRSIVAHHRSALRFASKRWRGRQRLLLGPAAALLAARAAALAAREALNRRAGPAKRDD